VSGLAFDLGSVPQSCIMQVRCKAELWLAATLISRTQWRNCVGCSCAQYPPTLYLHALLRRAGGIAGHCLEEANRASVTDVISTGSRCVLFVSQGSNEFACESTEELGYTQASGRDVKDSAVELEMSRALYTVTLEPSLASTKSMKLKNELPAYENVIIPWRCCASFPRLMWLEIMQLQCRCGEISTSYLTPVL
jgi:hypothetical protein